MRCYPSLPAICFCLVALQCEGCPTEGCDMLGTEAEAVGAALAGVVAESSDVVANGCQECPFGSATLEVWKVEEPVASPDELAELVVDTPPTLTIQAEERFQQSVEPGDYVVCVQQYCLNTSVAEGATTTMNIKLRNGPTSFFVASDIAGKLTEDFGMEVPADEEVETTD